MKKVFAIILTLSILTWAGSVMAYTLPSTAAWSWTDGNSNVHNYYVFTGSMIWDDAYGGLGADQYLATITSQEEQDALFTGMGNLTGEFWLGGIQANPSTAADADWSWQDTDEDFCYTCWAPGEPNEWAGTLEMYLGTWSRYDWMWNDEHAQANIAGFIVETGTAYGPDCAPVPEPSTIILLGSGLLGLGLYGRKRKKA